MKITPNLITRRHFQKILAGTAASSLLFGSSIQWSMEYSLAASLIASVTARSTKRSRP